MHQTRFPLGIRFKAHCGSLECCLTAEYLKSLLLRGGKGGGTVRDGKGLEERERGGRGKGEGNRENVIAPSEILNTPMITDGYRLA